MPEKKKNSKKATTAKKKVVKKTTKKATATTAKTTQSIKKPATKKVAKKQPVAVTKKTVKKEVKTVSADTNMQNVGSAPKKELSPEMVERRQNQIYAVLFGLVGLAIVLSGAYFGIPAILDTYPDEARIAREREEQEEEERKREEESQAQINEENQSLEFIDRQVTMNIENFGELKLNLDVSAAPRNVENFTRLISRGYYDDLTFHRITTLDTFGVIQGGDPLGTGAGGESAFGTPVDDEIWQVAPEFQEGSQTIINDPVFTEGSLYTNLDKNTGSAVMPKGTLAMANSGVNTNGSQFFITTVDTTIPPLYTVLGSVDASSLDVLENIRTQVRAVDGSGNTENTQGDPVQDGRPSVEMRITSVTL